MILSKNHKLDKIGISDIDIQFHQNVYRFAFCTDCRCSTVVTVIYLFAVCTDVLRYYPPFVATSPPAFRHIGEPLLICCVIESQYWPAVSVCCRMMTTAWQQLCNNRVTRMFSTSSECTYIHTTQPAINCIFLCACSYLHLLLLHRCFCSKPHFAVRHLYIVKSQQSWIWTSDWSCNIQNKPFPVPDKFRYLSSVKLFVFNNCIYHSTKSSDMNTTRGTSTWKSPTWCSCKDLTDDGEERIMNIRTIIYFIIINYKT